MRMLRRCGVLGRLALVGLVAASIGATLWGLSAAVRQPGGDAGAPPGVSAADLTVAALVVPALPTVATSPTAPAVSGPSTPTAAGPDGLAPWAQQTASLVAVPAAELTGYGAAELATRTRTPGCHLSWLTLAAVGRADPARAAGAPLGTAAALCAGGRDTGTATGWTTAVRSLGGGPGELEKVLALATSYADALRSGVPISALARAAIDFAVSQIGLPYVWGGNGPQNGDFGFDCSGLTSAAYESSGIALPRTADGQFRATPRVAAPDLRPGDLVFYGNPAGHIHHVGLYIGNGVMINAPTFGMAVQVAPVHTPGDDLAGAGRPA